MELVVVIVIIGVLAVVTIPLLLDTKVFDERGFHDAVKAAVQHARKTAVASRRYVCAVVTSGTGPAGRVAIWRDDALPELGTTPVGCLTLVSLPAPSSVPGCAVNEVCAPAGVTLAGAGTIFDPLGRPVDSSKTALTSNVTLSVSGQTITIQFETGLVL